MEEQSKSALQSWSFELLSFTSAARRMKFATLALRSCQFELGDIKGGRNIQNTEAEDTVDIEL